jgi:anti-sigma regulatory factor (Ser/Thr protein kinase)
MEIVFSPYPTFRSVTLNDPSQPGEARRAGSVLARELSFTDEKRAEVEIMVTELANNCIKHGGGGQLILSARKDEGRLDILALDKGQGIANMGEALRDGYSSAGTPGNGLGAVQRIAEHFEVFTRPKGGTAILARVRSAAYKPTPLDTGAVSLPISGERVCGDAYAYAHSSARSIYMMVDGLGHGPIAAEAASVALEIFQRYCSDPAAEIMDRMHNAMRSTRGAAVGIAEIQYDRTRVVYCGVGNIAATCVSAAEESARSMISHNGTIGHQAPKIADFTYPWAVDSRLIMHSDGLSARFSLKTYPGLLQKDPALVAAVLYRDHVRQRDDATILVAAPRAA